MAETARVSSTAGTLRFHGVSKSFPHHRGQMLLRDRLLDFVNPSRRPRFAAIQELTFEVRPGESLGLLGPNGAGKSTILNLATGLLEPDAGFVEAHGRVTPLLDLLGGLQSDLTGVENLRLNASMLGFTRKDFEERLEQIVEFSGVRDFLHEQLRTYSQGMQLRLAFSDRKSTRLNSSHIPLSRMPSSA